MNLVTGAAGKTGRAVIGALAARGAKVRALVHREAQVDDVRALGASEAAVGDMQDADVLRRAMDGVRTVYHITPNMHRAEMSIGQAVIAAAEGAGVERLVYHSVLHPQAKAMPHHRAKLRVEELLFTSRLKGWTILQPTAYMQNILAGWQRIVEEGIYRVPYGLDTRLSLVDVRDVGQAAAIVLTEPGHNHAIYELCSPDAPTQREVAEALSKALGTPLRAQAIPAEQWRADAAGGDLGQYALDTLTAMFRYYDRHGMQGNANVLEWLLGKPPTTLAAFLENYVKQTD